MRNIKWIVIAALMIPAAGCVEDSSYPSYAYNDGGYAPAYYQPAYQQVYVPQTRYVAAPAPAPQRTVARPAEHSAPQHEQRNEAQRNQGQRNEGQHHDEHSSANDGNGHNRDSDRRG
jgi:hypothetical protein